MRFATNLQRAACALALCCVPVIQSQTPATDTARLKASATQAFIYGYPLVLMDVTRERLTNVPKPVTLGMAPANQFGNTITFPDETVTAVVSPNADTLYSQSWLDLSQGPIVLTVKDMGKRYFLLPMMDGWTNVFISPGTRTNGNGPHTYLIAGPGWHGKTPAHMELVKSPTAMVWLLGRIQTNGASDFAAVRELQTHLTLAPLGAPGSPAAHAPDATLDMATPPAERLDKMDAPAFFNRLASLLPANPPFPADKAEVANLASLGVVAGQPFDAGKLGPEGLAAIADGIADARKKVLIYARTSPMAKRANGWMYITTGIGEYGSDYLGRAAVARVGLGANIPADAVYYTLRADTEGKPLSGAAGYTLHFAKGETPPVHAFWSMTMYNAKQFFVANPIHRYAIGDRDPLKFNPDGSLDIFVQHDSPGAAREANWLPAPEDSFNLILRAYWPKPAILDGSWHPPVLEKAR